MFIIGLLLILSSYNYLASIVLHFLPSIIMLHLYIYILMKLSDLHVRTLYYIIYYYNKILATLTNVANIGHSIILSRNIEWRKNITTLLTMHILTISLLSSSSSSSSSSLLTLLFPHVLHVFLDVTLIEFSGKSSYLITAVYNYIHCSVYQLILYI